MYRQKSNPNKVAPLPDQNFQIFASGETNFLPMISSKNKRVRFEMRAKVG